MSDIVIRGARVHNLKNVSLTIPKNKLVVFTGISGSGKSSMAFDTLYAEGQRRYVESLSSYARQFLGIMGKPDVDAIDGLSPAISIDQKTASHNPRSTVGTVTEIYDYLRLLYARVGSPFCPNCHIEVISMSVDEITQSIVNEITTEVSKDKLKPHGFFLLSPIVKNKRGEFVELFDNLLHKGFTLARIDGYFYDIAEEDLLLFKNNKHTIDVVIDRLRVDNETLKDPKKNKELSSRLFRAIENATALSGGIVIVGTVVDSGFDLPTKPKKLLERTFSEQFACPQCGEAFAELEPRLFSFNSPIGACKECRGLGVVMRADEDRIVNNSLSIAEGGVFPFSRIIYSDTWFGRLVKQVLEEFHIEANVPLKTLSQEQRDILLYGTKKVFHVRGRNREGAMTSIHESFRGFVKEIEHRYYDAADSTFDMGRYMREEVCPLCKGARLNQLASSVRVGSKNIVELCDMPISQELTYLQAQKEIMGERRLQIAQPILKEIDARLSFLMQVGLSYLTLSRRANTLSGGEAQRIRLASQIGTGLTGITYVLDEPSIGLHARDVSRLLDALKHLRDLENSVIVVEHDWETIQSADHIVDFGPYAGKHGGEVIAQGTRADIENTPASITGNYLSGRKIIPIRRSTLDTSSMLEFIGCTENNLQNISVSLPLNRMVGVTGVSGSGKSSLLLDTVYTVIKNALDPYYKGQLGKIKDAKGLAQLERVVLIDQSPIGRTPRSNPATYTGVFTSIREIFALTQDAKARGYNPGRFSFNVRGGRCENCQGAGVIKVEMQFLADLYVTCDVCLGKRYNRETLDVRYKDKNIAEVLSMTVEEALGFFENNAKISKILMVLNSVGLGYIELGQSAPTLSGGEAQRVKLAKELYTNVNMHTIYILDEPTTGLHYYDVDKLISVMRHLVDQGNTVFLVEHNLDVIKNCDYVIDLGPEGGDEGGSVVFQGSVQDILKNTASYTGKYLREYMK